MNFPLKAIIPAVLFASLAIAGCGKLASSSSSSSSGVTVSMSAPSTQVSSLSLMGGLKTAALSTLGLSTMSTNGETGVAGATVVLIDPLTSTVVANVTVTDAGSGQYTFSGSGLSGLSGPYLVKGTKTIGSQTLVMETLINMGADTGAAANAENTLALAAANSGVASGAGGTVSALGALLSGATSGVSAGNRSTLASSLYAMFTGYQSAIGTLSGTGFPDMTAASGQSIDDLLLANSGIVSAATSGKNLSAVTSIVSQFKDSALSTLAGATYTSGMTMPPFDFNKIYDAHLTFTAPSGMVAGSGVTLPSGTGFTMPVGMVCASGFSIPSAYTSYLPSGMVMSSGFSGLPSGISTLPSGVVFSGVNMDTMMGGSAYSGTLPSGCQFSGVTIPVRYANALPNDVHFGSGTTLPSGVVIPTGADFKAAITVPVDAQLQSGFTIPSYLTFPSAYSGTIPSGVAWASSATVPSYVADNLASGYTFAGGVPKFDSGFELPGNCKIGDGWVVPSGMGFASGYSFASAPSFATGFTFTSAMVSNMSFGSGFSWTSDMLTHLASDAKIHDEWKFASGVQIDPSKIESGFTIASGASYSFSGGSIPSGVSFGYTPSSGDAFYSGFMSGSFSGTAGLSGISGISGMSGISGTH